ncbi:monocarboxylate transporter 12-like [Saccoglossus kowalevskii]|uniref:Monocarboxylate transporter 12-like n=1 Tax=Saccoglossus kowalevskii TaxID=10224 RepID=A0ABM0LXX2_SACKO|nr:PREDICTED: monocarboxylate transporter 12-like [Saccoglossus kowalevskii]
MKPQTFDHPPDGGWGWCVLFSSMVVRLMAFGTSSLAGVIIRALQSTLTDNSAVDTIWVTSLYIGFSLCMCPVGAYFNDRYSTRPAMIIGATLSTVGLFLSFFASKVHYLHISYGVMTGIGHAFLHAAHLPILAKYFDKRFAFATGIACLGGDLGYFLFSPMIQLFVDKYGLRGAFLVMSAINAHAFACATVMRPINVISQDKVNPNPNESTNGCCKKIVHRLGFRLHCTHHGFALMMFATFFAALAYFSSLSLIIPHAVEIGVTELKATFLVATVGITSMAIKTIQGWCIDRYNIRALYLLPMLILMLGVSQLTMAVATTFPVMVVSCVLCGICNGVYSPSLYMSINEMVGATNFSRGNGIIVLYFGVAGIIGSQTGGKNFSFENLVNLKNQITDFLRKWLL